VKKTIWVLVLLLAVFVLICLIPVFWIGTSQTGAEETFMLSSQSPDGGYELEAYRTEPGATVDFSIKVYIIVDGKKEQIYNAYHEYEVEIDWVNNSTVSINGRKLDLSLGEKYDWRTE
jgi:ABC-type glycerol-3-phosphate transport system permease component